MDGIPVTSIARTLLDLADVVEAQGLRRLCTEAERLEHLDRASITALLDRTSGRRGTGALRALLAEDVAEEARTDSEFELEFFDLLRDADVPMPVAGAVVDGYKVDAYWPEANLVVELDGYEYHRDREAFERDRRKIAELRLAGREVLPLTYRQVEREPEWVTGTVGELVRRGLARVSAASA
jgi:very-short-patch-repair endonuclease